MSTDYVKGFGSLGGFPVPRGFAAAGFPDKKMGFPDSAGFPAQEESVPDSTGAKNEIIETSLPQKKPKEYEGVLKLKKTDTVHAWKEFGGDAHAVFESDGSGCITREIERIGVEVVDGIKKRSVSFKLTERLVKDAEGYSTISWKLSMDTAVRRKPPKQKFNENWAPAILRKVREVVVGGVSVSAAAKDLSEEFGVSFSTMRANLWVADKWAKGEYSTFLPHRSMIRPIFELLCELGKKDAVLSSLIAYSKEVSKPSESVMSVLADYR